MGTIAGYETAGTAEKAGEKAIYAKLGDRAIANAEIPRGERPHRKYGHANNRTLLYGGRVPGRRTDGG